MTETISKPRAAIKPSVASQETDKVSNSTTKTSTSAGAIILGTLGAIGIGAMSLMDDKSHLHIEALANEVGSLNETVSTLRVELEQANAYAHSLKEQIQKETANTLAWKQYADKLKAYGDKYAESYQVALADTWVYAARITELSEEIRRLNKHIEENLPPEPDGDYPDISISVDDDSVTIMMAMQGKIAECVIDDFKLIADGEHPYVCMSGQKHYILANDQERIDLEKRIFDWIGWSDRALVDQCVDTLMEELEWRLEEMVVESDDDDVETAPKASSAERLPKQASMRKSRKLPKLTKADLDPGDII